MDFDFETHPIAGGRKKKKTPNMCKQTRKLEGYFLNWNQQNKRKSLEVYQSHTGKCFILISNHRYVMT